MSDDIKFKTTIEQEPEDNHERWLVSYADFMTLLLAFFVAMYATKVSQDTSSTATTQQFSQSVMSALGQLDKEGKPIIDKTAKEYVELMQRKARIARISEELRKLLRPLEASGQVRITEGDKGIDIEISAGALFASGRADIEEEASKTLRQVGAVLAKGNFPVSVEGHTDSLPINSSRFPSNWELSASRAASVVRLFSDTGVDAAIMKATGYAEQRPVADNTTADGRARNRRIAILIETFHE